MLLLPIDFTTIALLTKPKKMCIEELKKNPKP